MKGIRIGVIFGGRSREHEISLMSATNIINAIDKNKFEVTKIGITKDGRWLLYDGPTDKIETGEWQEVAEKAWEINPVKYEICILGTNGRSIKDIIDFALPILHGPNGEDGTIQGLLETIDIPYGGCNVLSSAVAMDKYLAKEVFKNAGIPICKHQLVLKEDFLKKSEFILEHLEKELPYPMFVKPSNMGSSVGISKAKDREMLKEAINIALNYDRRVIVEEAVNCRELETAVLGNAEPKAAEVGEIIASEEFYDYKAKYLDGGKSKLCIPADISPEIYDEIRHLAIKAYKEIDCSGYARVDFFLENDTNKVIINEINTIPGFTKYSMFPLLWVEAGVAYSDVIERIIALGYERYNAKNNR